MGGGQGGGGGGGGFTFVQAITFMTMQSNPCYDGKNHKNDNLDQFESTAR